MKHAQRVLLVALRVALGILMLYAGVSKLMKPGWSAAGYLKGAMSLHGLYVWFSSPAVLPVINILNEWGLTLLGISLILGVFVRLSSSLGVLLMVLYYFPILHFPKVGDTGYLVDEHVIYGLVLWLLAVVQAGRRWGLDGILAKSTLYRRMPWLGNFLG